MSAFRLPPDTKIGHVRLRVADLARVLGFYRDLIGLREIERGGSTCRLSADGSEPALLTLTEESSASPRPERTTGLYHFAVLLPSRPELARACARLRQEGWPIHGASDHGVSEALYLADPEDNHVELYADRPRELWPRSGDRIAMRTDSLDLDDLLRETDGSGSRWSGIHPKTTVGHVHLNVSRLSATEEFYHNTLGFDVTQRDYPGALFLSAGGYHHHVAGNVWAGIGIPPPPPEARGLVWFSVHVSDREAFEVIKVRAATAGVEVDRSEADQPSSRILIRDPDSNGVEIVCVGSRRA